MTLDRNPDAVGSTVRVDFPGNKHHDRIGIVTYSGETGEFHGVTFANGDNAIFHGSDLVITD